MRCVTLLLTLISSLSIAVGSAGELKAIASSQIDKTVSAFTELGRIVLPAREILVEGTYPDGKPLLGNLLIVFDPSTGNFLWSCQTRWVPLESRGDERKTGPHNLHLIEQADRGKLVVYADRDHLTAFALMADPLDIYVRQSSQESTNDVDAAELRAFKEAAASLVALQHNYWYGWRVVTLSKHVDREFVVPRHSAAPVGPSTFVGLSRMEGIWNILLKGQWVEKVTIDDRYELIKAEHVK